MSSWVLEVHDEETLEQWEAKILVTACMDVNTNEGGLIRVTFDRMEEMALSGEVKWLKHNQHLTMIRTAHLEYSPHIQIAASSSPVSAPPS